MSVAAVRQVVCRLAPDRPPTDAELVLALTGTEREAAFGALVERYGAMVLGVCRRVLADTHDAEDAFQAAFLVLARKANTIGPPGAVGGWLYGVAVRTARKAKTAAARRRRREMAAMNTACAANSTREVGGELQRAELRAVIDDELAALPEMQRAAVVLCDLHGKTRAAAAAELDRPEGTVAAWLARGRKALAARLARRGVALTAAGLVAVASPAVVSAELTSSAFAALVGRGVSPAVVALAEQVMRTLSAGKKLVGALVAVGALLAAVATAGAWAGGENPQPEKDAPEPRVVPLEDPAKPDPLAWKEKQVLDLNGWLGGSVCFSADGKTLFVGGTGGYVRAYETATMKQLWEAKEGEHFAAVALSPDSETVAATVKDGVRFFDARTGKTGDLLEEKGSAPHAVAYLPFETEEQKNRRFTRHKVVFGNARGYFHKTWMVWPNVATIDTAPVTTVKHDDEYAVPLAAAPEGGGAVLTINTLNVWWAWLEKNSGGKHQDLKGHKAPVVSAAWARDGKLIVTGDAAGVVILWDAEKFKEKSQLKLDGRVAALAISPDGKSVAAAVVRPALGIFAAYFEDVLVWDTAAPGKPEPLASHFGNWPFNGFASIAFAPDGKTLVSCFANFLHLARDGKLVGRVHVFTPVQPAAKPAPTAKPVTDVSFGPDGKRYVVVRGDKAEVYDAETGRQTFAVPAEAARFMGAPVLAVLGSKDIAYYDEKGRPESVTHPRPKASAAWRRIAFSPDGKRLAAHFGLHVCVYAAATGLESVRPEDQFEQAGRLTGRAAESISFSADGKKLLASGVKLNEGGQLGVAVWDTSTGKRLRAYPVDAKNELTAAAFTPTGSAIVVGFQDRVEVWPTDPNVKTDPTVWYTDGPVTALAFSVDGKQLAIGLRVRSFDRWWADVREAYKGEVLLLDAETGKELRKLGGFKRDSVLLDDGKVKEPTPDVLRGHSGVWFDLEVAALAFSPDGKKLLAATALPNFGPTVKPVVREGEVKLFDLSVPAPAPKPAAREWEKTAELVDHGRLVNGIAVNPDGKSFAAATEGNVTCWDAVTRKKLWQYQPKDGKCLALAYSPDGAHVVVATEKSVLRLDAKTGKASAWEDAAGVAFGGATALAYSPDGKRLAAGNGYRVSIYPAGGGKAPIVYTVREAGDTDPAPGGLAWHPEGAALAAPVRLMSSGFWRVAVNPLEAGQVRHQLVGHKTSVTALAWSKDGKVIVSGDADGVVIAWNAATGKELWRKKYGDGAGRIHALAISPEDHTVAMGVWLGARKTPERVVLLAGKDGAELQHLFGVSNLPVTSVAWEGNGKYLITGCGALPGQVVTQTEPAVGEVLVWERKP